MKRRRGTARKCLYKGCNHTRETSKCSFHFFPQSNDIAARWLLNAGVGGLTPKRLKAHHYLCSCHFPDGRDKDPIDCEGEYDDVEDISSPVAKRMSTEGESNIVVLAMIPIPRNDSGEGASATPRTQSAAKALLALRQEAPVEAVSCSESSSLACGPLHESTPLKTTTAKLRNMSSPKFSPRRRLWMLHNTATMQSPRKSLQRMLDLSDIVALPSEDKDPMTFDGEDSDIGVSSLRSEECDSTFPAKENTNYLHALHPSCTTDINSTCVDCPEAVAGLISESAGQEEKATRSIGIQCERPYLSYARCKQLPEKEFQFYTGIAPQIFEMVYEFLGGDEVCSQLKYEYTVSTPRRQQFQGDLFPKDKMFLTLLRVRRGIPFRDLKMLFQISEGHASKIFYTWIRFMRLEFKKFESFMFISAAAQPKEEIPKCFRAFDDLRVIIDTCHFKIQKPIHLQQSSNTFSEYKSCNTLKFLVGISCFGGLSFLSEGYEGSITDRKLVQNSGFMDHLEAGDTIMGDKGFDMQDLADEKGVNLLIPAFMQGRSALTGRELILSRAIAESRIHVERFIGKMNEFRLIRYVIPNTVLPVASDIVTVCANLVNFQHPYIRWGDDEDFDG